MHRHGDDSDENSDDSEDSDQNAVSDDVDV